MAGSECAFAICTALPTLEEAVEHAHAQTQHDHAANDEYVANDTSHDGDHVLGEVQLEVFVTPQAEDLLRLDDLGRQTVAVNDALRARARLNELWRNA